MKLTEAQKHALANIDQHPRKSGKFWRDLGIRPQIISILEAKGLIAAEYRTFTGETTILRRQWFILNAGRQALKGGGE